MTDFTTPGTLSTLGFTSASPGDNYVYHEGFLADRVTQASDAEKAEGVAALLAFSRGEVEIAQRRVKSANGKIPGSFQYIAQKRRLVRTPKACGDPWENPLHWAGEAAMSAEKALDSQSQNGGSESLEIVLAQLTADWRVVYHRCNRFSRCIAPNGAIEAIASAKRRYCAASARTP